MQEVTITFHLDSSKSVMLICDVAGSIFAKKRTEVSVLFARCQRNAFSFFVFVVSRVLDEKCNNSSRHPFYQQRFPGC